MTIETSKGEYAQLVVTPTIDVSTGIAGQITVTTAGTAVQGDDVPLDNGVNIKFLDANTGLGYVGDEDVDSSSGHELNPGEGIPVHVSNLNELWFDASVNGEKFSWIKI